MFQLKTLRSHFLWILAVGILSGLIPFSENQAEAEELTGQPPKEARALDLEIEVEPVRDFLDESEELNPISQSSLENLAAKFHKEAKVFKKYAFLPKCTSDCSGGIDHLAAGTGTRNTGFGTIRFRGAPPGATPTSAFLYWATIDTRVLVPPVNQTVNLNGSPVTGFLIGVGPNPCWGFGINRLYVYRAPVLPSVLPGINGDYTVSGLPTNLTNGQNPWNPVNTVTPLSEGASLVVFYSHSSVPRGTFTQIHHPFLDLPEDLFPFGTMTFSHLLNQPIQTAAMKHTRLGADGQVGSGLNNSRAIATERTWLAGPPPASPFIQIRGTGAYLFGSPDSDWNGHDGEPLNQLWDTHTMNIPNVITPGQLVTNYQVRYVATNDCVVPVAHVITAR